MLAILWYILIVIVVAFVIVGAIAPIAAAVIFVARGHAP